MVLNFFLVMRRNFVKILGGGGGANLEPTFSNQVKLKNESYSDKKG